MNRYYPHLLNLYKDGRITEAGLDMAIFFTWINAEEKAQIMAA